MEIDGAAGRWRWLSGNLSLRCGSGALCQTGFGRTPLNKLNQQQLRLSTSSFSLPGTALLWQQSQSSWLIALLQRPVNRNRGFSGWNLFLHGKGQWQQLRLNCALLHTLQDGSATAVSCGGGWHNWLLEVTGGDRQSLMFTRSWSAPSTTLLLGGYTLRQAPPGRWPLVTGSGEQVEGLVQELRFKIGSWRWNCRLQQWRLLAGEAPLQTNRARLEWWLQKRFTSCELNLRQRLELEETAPAGKQLAAKVRVRWVGGWVTGGLNFYSRTGYLWQLRLERGEWSLQARSALGAATPVAGSTLGLPGTIQWSWLQPGLVELRLRRHLEWHRYRCDLLLGYRLAPPTGSFPQGEQIMPAQINWGLQVEL